MLYSTNGTERNNGSQVTIDTSKKKKERKKIYCKYTHQDFKVQLSHDTTCIYNMGVVIVHFVFPRMSACIYNCHWNFDMHFMSSHFNELLSVGSIWDVSVKNILLSRQLQSYFSFQYLLNWFIIHRYMLKSEQVYSSIYYFLFLWYFLLFQGIHILPTPPPCSQIAFSSYYLEKMETTYHYPLFHFFQIY